MMRYLNWTLVLAPVTVFWSACSGPKAPAEAPMADTMPKVETPAQPVDELTDFKFHKTIGNIPYPATDVFTTVKKSNAAFDPALTNPVENATRYTTTSKKSLNYGAYSVDLLYLAMFDRHSELKKYFGTSRTLAKELDMLESFDEMANERTIAALESNDSIIALINGMYGNVDSYLRTNDRLSAASLILVGSWVESQYITLSIVHRLPSAAEYNSSIYKQKLTLLNLLNLLEEFKAEKGLAPVVASLKDLQKVYDGILDESEVAPKLNDLLKKTEAARKAIVN